MLLSTPMVTPKLTPSPLSNLISNPNNKFICRSNTLFPHRPTNATSSSLKNGTQEQKPCLQNPNPGDLDSNEDAFVPSAAAVAAAIRRCSSTSPVEFVQRIEKDGKNGLVLPSVDFQRLCLEQLDLFRRIVDRDASLSVYVRPAGSYVMDRLELRRVTCYPGANLAERADIVILIGNFGIPTGLHVAETALSNQQVEVISEYRAVVFPMVKHPFIVGFLVAELPMDFETCVDAQNGQGLPLSSSPDESYGLPPCSDRKMWQIQVFKEDLMRTYHNFTAEQRSRAIMISRSLSMAYVMDQKAALLQQSSWQNNIRMSNLVEQIRGPLSSIRTLSKMLSVHMKRTEISYDIIDDILVQGDHMRDTLQQLQDAVYLTKANIVHYNDETLKKMHNSIHGHQESLKSQLSDSFPRETQDNSARGTNSILSLGSGTKDLEMPMPPLALAALQQQNIRPCNVSEVLANLVGAARPLAHKQQRSLELNELSQPLQVAVEESALHQALSNLIEGALLRTHVGGKVEIIVTGAPAGGALIIIDDDGPDMHYMTQMRSLTPFGADLSEGMIEDNMTWNFVAGLTVAREILESYGSVVRVISPRSADAALGTGGTHIELWLPALPSDPTEPTQEA